MQRRNIMKKDIYEFIDIICCNLEIKKPRIQIGNIAFSKGTQLAAYDYKNKKIAIKDPETYENSADIFFAIAHELRHKYQIDHHKFDFENYRTTEEIPAKEYNLQKEELDANAYACIVMIDMFGIKPLFNGMDDKIINKIYKRIEEIVKSAK